MLDGMAILYKIIRMISAEYSSNKMAKPKPLPKESRGLVVIL